MDRVTYCIYCNASCFVSELLKHQQECLPANLVRLGHVNNSNTDQPSTSKVHIDGLMDNLGSGQQVLTTTETDDDIVATAHHEIWYCPYCRVNSSDLGHLADHVLDEHGQQVVEDVKVCSVSVQCMCYYSER